MALLFPYTDAEVEAFELEEVGVRDGSSPTHLFDKTGSIVVRHFTCAWAKRFDAARYFLGDVSVYVDGGGDSRLSRLLPQTTVGPMPDSPEFVAVKLAEPITGHKFLDGYLDPEAGPDEEPVYQYPFTASSNTVNRYKRAKFAVQYERVIWELKEDDEILEGEQERYTQYVPGPATTDYVTMPPATQRYIVEGGIGIPGVATPSPHLVPVPFPVGKSDPIHRFRLKWFRLPFTAFGPGTTLWNRIFGDDENEPWLGSVNAEEFWGLPAGTVLFEECVPTYDSSLFDSGFGSKVNWDLDFGFAVRPIKGWNWTWYFPNTAAFPTTAQKYFTGRGSTFHAANAVPDGYSSYNVRDLNNLWNIDAL